MENRVEALYVHIPFCNNLCYYCDFPKILYKKEWVDQYIEVLCEQIISDTNKYKSIYIGGGSPSSLDNKQLDKLLFVLKQKLESDYEFCIELNPEDMNKDKVLLLSQYGINRVSIGVQTFNEDLLRSINRKHSKQSILDLIEMLRQNNITNITCDLMFGLPNQDISDIKKDLDLLTALKIPHISTYALLIEPNTYFDVKKIKALDEDIQAEQYSYIYDYLTSKNYNRYEVSNYSLEGYESKHNLIYWHGKEYKALGSGASGYENRIRYDISKSVSSYLKGNVIKEETYIDEDDLEYEFIILSLRLSKGISLQEYQNKFNKNFLEVYSLQVDKLLKQGLIEIKDGYLYVKPSYMFILNKVLIEFSM